MCGRCGVKVYIMTSRLYGYKQIVPQFPKISGKLSACTNSGYQALFPAHQEPGDKASVSPTIQLGLLDMWWLKLFLQTQCGVVRKHFTHQLYSLVPRLSPCPDEK